ncbi:MAG: sulfite oxidase subunit YedZ [Pseudomonadota bacterium]|jgi:sulfoxide reductase heme-binding subunit YedZ
MLWAWLAGPLLELMGRAAWDGLGANPQEALLRALGQQTLMLLCLIVAYPVLSPRLPSELRQAWLSCRRMVGLWSFGYASIHLAAYWQFEHDLLWRPMWNDLFTRPFVTLGVLAWLALLPLAMTSNRWSMRRLQQGWKRLHRSLLPMAVFAGMVHFYLHKAGKNDFWEPALFTGLLALLIWRRQVASRRGPQKTLPEDRARVR